MGKTFLMFRKFSLLSVVSFKIFCSTRQKVLPSLRLLVSGDLISRIPTEFTGQGGCAREVVSKWCPFIVSANTTVDYNQISL